MPAIRFIRPRVRRVLTEKERVARHLESQRREANRPLGFRPLGISVSFGEIGADGLRRDVITVRFIRSLAAANFAFFMAGLAAACGFGLLETLVVMWMPKTYDVTTTINTAWPLLIPVALALSHLTLYIIFGRCELTLTGRRGVYTEGWWLFTRKREFTLEADSSIEVETKKEVSYSAHGGKHYSWAQEIVVRENRCSTVRLGKLLPSTALDYFRACIVRATAERPLMDAGFDPEDSVIPHPIWFAFCVLLALTDVVGVASCYESFAVRDGKLSIVDTKWFGVESRRVEVPLKEIACVRPANERSHKYGEMPPTDNSWVVEFLSKDGKALLRTRPFGICLVFWQNRLLNAVLKHPECPFFSFHFTHLGWLALLMIPCILFLIVTADYSRMAEPDEDW